MLKDRCFKQRVDGNVFIVLFLDNPLDPSLGPD